MPRAPALALLLASFLGACSGAPPPPPPKPATSSLCYPAHLDTCERTMIAVIASARAPTIELASAYVAARAERSAADAWAPLFQELRRDRAKDAALVAIVVEGPIPEALRKLGPGVRVVSIPALPTPAVLTDDQLLLGLAGAVGYRHVIHVRPATGMITQLFPMDPLAPFTAGVLPILRDDTTLTHVEDDVALDATLRAAFADASAYTYVDAAAKTERLHALVERRGRAGEPGLRGRKALQILDGAGLMLDAEGATDDKAEATPEEPAPTAADTPYGDLLRVATAKNSLRTWEARSAKILAVIAPDRRDHVASLYARATDCQAASLPPPMTDVRDLVFANRLAGALIRDKASEATAKTAGLIPLPEWLERYETELRLVSELHMEWAFTVSLLLQRGDAFGLRPEGTPTYKRVTEIGLAHLRASEALQAAQPVRYRPFSQLGLIYSPGLLADEPLREALIHLTQATMQGKLAMAHDAAGVFGGLLTGAFAGLSYPPALQQGHYVALQGAITAKLQGELSQATGWGVAALYALEAIYRLMADQGPKLGYSSAQVARALGDPQIAHPALAALATASARYAALAAERKLDPEQRKVDRFPPERRAARDALRSALAGLGDPGEAPNNVLDDVTDLADGLIATLSASVSAKAPESKGSGLKSSPASCAGKPPVTLTPTTRRALDKLGDLRQRILSHPRYKGGDGRWVRRIRLLVTVLSDAMDVARKDTKRLAFTIPTSVAETNVTEALQEWDARAAADGVAALYALTRDLATAESPESFLMGHGPALRRVVTGVVAILRADTAGGPAKGPLLGVALLDAVAKLDVEHLGERDIHAMLLSYAKAFYAQNQRDQGDLWLLSTILISAVTQAPPSPETIALAASSGSRVEWALRFLAEVNRGRKDTAPDPAVYAPSMRKADREACQSQSADDTLAVMGAVHDFAAGKKSEARAALDRVLEKADHEGIGVPRMSYRYEEKTVSRVFTVTLEVSYGAGVLANANTFQVGLGLRSPGEPEGALTAAFAPADTPKASEEAARYYVHTAALATVYHLIEGDEERATAAARRVIATLTSGVRLGSRVLRTEKPAAWGADARALIALAAVLAADHGMPFLAGDLWTVLRNGLGDDLDDAQIAAITDPLPLGLGGIPEVRKEVERARKSLKIVADPLACTTARVELGSYEEASCDGYPLALSLRIADVLKKLPRLRRADSGGPRCAPLRSLDAFLATAEKGAYDPDAFTRAEEDLRADGRSYEAATLLTRQRRDNHCNPTILAATRGLGRLGSLGPLLRSDLLSVAINCAIGGGGAELERDLLSLDDETRALPDPTRNLKVLLTVADLAGRTNQWALLGKLAAQPDFVERWMAVHPTAATGALLIAHATPVLSGGAPNLEKTRGSYHLLCELFPPGERAGACADLKALRAPLEGPIAGRQLLAKEAVKRMVARFTGP